MAERIPESVDDQLDRLAARSLAASDRAGPAKAAPSSRAFLPWILTTGAVAFALGLIANPWFETSVRSRLPGQFQHPVVATSPPEAARVDGLETRVSALEAAKAEAKSLPASPPALLPAGLAVRIAVLEAEAARLAAADAGVAARLDQMAAAAGSTVAGQREMKELFLLTAARRFLQTGRPFGAFERVLTQTFSPRDPAAANALATWSAAPHSRDSLAARLQSPVEAAAPKPQAAAGWWDRLVSRLSGVVQVRSDAALGAGAPEREKALDALAMGDLSRAIAAMEILPPSPAQALWIADAKRLQAAEQGLDSLEALLLAAPPAAEAASAPTGTPAAEPPPQPGLANTY